ncbi:MAG: hypothetical protein PHW15_02765 [Patescibacteria group bacterium]|nr:hypothetical protein [Patescibacteria group bacterium]
MSKIQKAFQLIGVLEWELGKELSYIKSHNDFKSEGDHVNSWQDFLKEIGITYTKAQGLIDLYETFPDLEEFEHCDRLKEVAKFHKMGIVKNLKEVYDKAISLTIKDWRDELNIIQGKSSYLTCEHKNAENYIRCKDCGKWLKI